MTAQARFAVSVGADAAERFAALSGDWNPLHTDADYARATAYGRPILHGAYSAGLISRLAGMHLPGANCLLHGMRLRFIAPILTPAELIVEGRLAAETSGLGRVEATVRDAISGVRYVEASYEFSAHEHPTASAPRPPSAAAAGARGARILVTGATGGLGREVLGHLGAQAVGLSRRGGDGLVRVEDLEGVDGVPFEGPLDAVVHCAWPSPDNVRLLDLVDARSAVEHHVAGPLRQVIALARLLEARGTPDAVLVLVGSTAALPGRHNYRSPLYSLAKTLVPELARILALELGAGGRRVLALVFDVIEAGMNQRLSKTARMAHASRSPTGQLPSGAEAAAQIGWVLSNRSSLLSGATITLSGGAMP